MWALEALWETAIRIPPATSCGRVISEGSRQLVTCSSEHRLWVGLGVDDLVVIET